MDELRKSFLVAGLYLGDINLALASVARELPTYVKGVDPNSLLGEEGEVERLRQVVESWLAGGEKTELDSAILERILERAIAGGRYLSAIRCLEMLGKREAYVRDYISKGEDAVGKNDFREAAEAFVIASSLDLNEGLPLFQYTGADLHRQCTLHPENCITRRPIDEALSQALTYMLGSQTVAERIAGFKPEIQAQLLPWIVLERDPLAPCFYRYFEQAHSQIEGIGDRALKELGEKLKTIVSAIKKFKSRLNGQSGSDPVVGKIKRIADGLVRDFETVEELLRNWQFLRIERRLERVIESGHIVSESLERLRQDTSLGDVAGEFLEVARKVEEDGLVGRVQGIQNSLLETQVIMLGRKVASQEHWQFLREIAFKYPSAPLMCCLRRLNDRWLVVPIWEGPIVGLLREHLKAVSV